MSAEWHCSSCGAWVPTKYTAHVHYDSPMTKRLESDPVREVDETRGPKVTESRWFVVYRSPLGKHHAIVHSDGDFLLWSRSMPKPIFSRKIPARAWDTPLATVIELYESGLLEGRVRVKARSSESGEISLGK